MGAGPGGCPRRWEWRKVVLNLDSREPQGTKHPAVTRGERAQAGPLPLALALETDDPTQAHRFKNKWSSSSSGVPGVSCVPRLPVYFVPLAFSQ